MSRITDPLRKQILRFLKGSKTWRHKGYLLRKKWRGEDGFFMPSTVGRTLRKLESEGEIAVRDDKYGKSVEYKYLEGKEKEEYTPKSERPETLFNEYNY